MLVFGSLQVFLPVLFGLPSGCSLWVPFEFPSLLWLNPQTNPNRQFGIPAHWLGKPSSNTTGVRSERLESRSSCHSRHLLVASRSLSLSPRFVPFGTKRVSNEMLEGEKEMVTHDLSTLSRLPAQKVPWKNLSNQKDDPLASDSQT